MTVTSAEMYEVSGAARSTAFPDGEVLAEYTAKMGGAFVVVERPRLAIEGKMKGDIAHFIDRKTGEHDRLKPRAGGDGCAAIVISNEDWQKEPA
jgi:hypothetical protein